MHGAGSARDHSALPGRPNSLKIVCLRSPNPRASDPLCELGGASRGSWSSTSRRSPDAADVERLSGRSGLAVRSSTPRWPERSIPDSASSASPRCESSSSCTVGSARTSSSRPPDEHACDRLSARTGCPEDRGQSTAQTGKVRKADLALTSYAGLPRGGWHVAEPAVWDTSSWAWHRDVVDRPEVTGNTRVLVHLGSPIGHAAKAPAMFNADLRRRGLDAVLIPLEVPARP